LLYALAAAADASVIPLDLLDSGDSRGDETMADVADRARSESPALVHVEDIDALAPAGDPGDRSDAQRRRTVRLRRLLDDLADATGVVVVGEAHEPDDVHRSLRRAGRFDREVEFRPPDADDRREILAVHTRALELGADVDLDGLAERTHGFVGADLASLCRSAVAAAVRRADAAGESVPTAVTAADVESALAEVSPSGMREATVEVPTVSFDDVGGLAEAKRELVRAVEWPLRYPGLFDRLGITPPQGVLLYGPPGTGKTLLARAVASATDANFLSVKGPELLDKYVGESERAVRGVFERARENAPAVVFFDEVDAVSPERGDDSGAAERVVSQLLTELDGLERLEGVTVIGATNRPDRIDPALLRPGRFERIVGVPVPDEAAREAIFGVHTRSMPLSPDVDLVSLARRTDGYTGSDIEAVVREAGMLAMEATLSGTGPSGDGRAGDAGLDGTAPGEGLPDVLVDMAEFEAALESSRPSLSADRRRYYENLREESLR
jgi:transitional endoplasmic reticulum ATPase